MDEQSKERLVTQLRSYLDGLPTTPDDDSQATREVDLYTLFTELAGLRNEVRLESRHLKRALDEFSGAFSALEDNSKRLQGELDGRREDQAAATARGQRPLLLELIELRDRLAQARHLAAGHKMGAWARLFSRREQALIADMAEGLDITLRRLDQALAGYDVAPIKAVGEPIDPHVMRVAGVRTEPDQANGVALEEVRRGYRRAGEVLRLAEVVANKAHKTEQDI